MMIIKINLNQNKDIPETDVLFWVDKRFFNLNQEKMKKENKKVQMFKAEYTVHEMAMIRRSMEHYLNDYVNATHGFESPEGQQEEKDIIKKWLKDDFFGRLLKGATKIADVVVADGKMTMTKVKGAFPSLKTKHLPEVDEDIKITKSGESKMTANGISTTIESGSEQYEGFYAGHGSKRKKMIAYDYRHTNGNLFACVKRTLAECRDAKCEWLKGQGTYYLNGEEETLNYILESTNAQEVARQGSAEKNNLIIWFQTTDDNVIKEKNILSMSMYDMPMDELNDWQQKAVNKSFITGKGKFDALQVISKSMYKENYRYLDELQKAMCDMKYDKERVSWGFLDYTIKNSWNSDGFVITKDHNSSNLWECHLGNYATIEDAMKSCVLHFMIARPESFNGNVHARMLKSGGGLYREFSTFKEVCEKEGILIPEEVTHSADQNHSICFKGIKV